MKPVHMNFLIKEASSVEVSLFRESLLKLGLQQMITGQGYSSNELAYSYLGSKEELIRKQISELTEVTEGKIVALP